jgi:hypothetical protein
VNIAELIQELTDIQDVHGSDVDVQLAVQPSWPLRHAIDGLTFAEDALRASEYNADMSDDELQAEIKQDYGHSQVLFISATSGHGPGMQPYAPKGAFDNCW